VLVEEGLVTPRQEGKLVFEAPAGVIEAEYSRDNSGNVVEVKLRNIPSFLYRTGLSVEVPGFGPLTFDVAYGGNFYAIIEPQPSYPGLDAVSAGDIQRLSPVIRRLINETYEFVHPENRRSPASATCSGPARRTTRRRTRGTRCSTARRRSTARPAAPAPRAAWRSLRRAAS
jgi:proline racemase